MPSRARNRAKTGQWARADSDSGGHIWYNTFPYPNCNGVNIRMQLGDRVRQGNHIWEIRRKVGREGCNCVNLTTGAVNSLQTMVAPELINVDIRKRSAEWRAYCDSKRETRRKSESRAV